VTLQLPINPWLQTQYAWFVSQYDWPWQIVEGVQGWTKANI